MTDPDLGPCCACGRSAPDVRIRTFLALDLKGPLPGRGWGCVVCHLPNDGAVAVLCDDCAPRRAGDKPRQDVRWACRGYPATDGRVPIQELATPHRHDLRYHPEARGDPRLN